MASQSTTNSPPVQSSSPASSSPSVSLASPSTAQRPSSSPATSTPPVAPPTNSASPASTNGQAQTSSHQSTSTPAPTSLSSTSQVSPAASAASAAPTITPSPSPVGNGFHDPKAGHAPLKIIIPAVSAVAGILVLLMVYHLHRRYQRKRQVKEAPLPVKRTPVILENRRAKSMYRLETPQTQNNVEYDSLMVPVTFPPSSSHYSGTGSHLSLSLPPDAGNTLDPASTRASPTPPASASAVSLERQSSMLSPPSGEVKDPSIGSLPGNHPSTPPQFSQPFTPPYTRRDPRPIPRHSRPVSTVSVASRHSAHSLAAMRSGQHPGSGNTLRGAPHRNNVNIVLPQPLAPSSRPSSMYNTHYGEPPPVPPRHTGPMEGISPHPLAQGLTLGGEHGQLRHRSNASRDRMREGWEESNSGSYRGTPSSEATMPYLGIPHVESAPATINWRHGGAPLIGPPGYNTNMATNVPPVPSLPQIFQVFPVSDSRASATSNTLAHPTPPTSLVQLHSAQQPPHPRPPLSKRISVDENIPERNAEVHTTMEPETLGRSPQSEESVSRPPLLPDSVFADPYEELDSATHESRRTSVSSPDISLLLPRTDTMDMGRTHIVDAMHPGATPATP